MHFRPTSPTRPMTPDHHVGKHSFSKAGMWIQRVHDFFVRDDSRCHSPTPIDDHEDDILSRSIPDQPKNHQGREVQAANRPIGIGLPRQATFKRQNSERRERLCPVESSQERRAVSSQRHKSTSLVRPRTRTRSSPPPFNPTHRSAPTVGSQSLKDAPISRLDDSIPHVRPQVEEFQTDGVIDFDLLRPPRPLSRASSLRSSDDGQRVFDDRALLNAELDTTWILNLSMHFRDKSDREKFFVTYAETPTSWRRVTVSCDYRNAEPGSLEKDLKELTFQRDKSLQIYDAIRDSLPEIQFYDSVTNLKLETSEGRLHVHVTEDVNEIIPYPPRSMLRHILDDGPEEARPREAVESDVVFDAHLSGFVYRVSLQGKTYIKKEIPGPDTIDEFLYEVNALHALHQSSNVVKLEAIILDDKKEAVKGLLITYAPQGAIVDILYDHKGAIPWAHREKWAKQAIMGLRDIHEAGYVQGDFTLSNIVVDENNDAKIIDINRRGCPVGWEPPEIAQKIASNQRISMYIGEKSDLYQLGMTLWALAMDDDEPERHDPPLSTEEFPTEVPDWYQEIVRICLSSTPQQRISAKELVKLFPLEEGRESPPEALPKPNLAIRTGKQYIDPSAAVERDDLERFRLQEEEDFLYSPESSKEDYTYTFPKSSNYDYEELGSAWDGRGRTPASNIEHLSVEERARRNFPPPTVERNYSDTVVPNIIDASPGSAPKYDEVTLDGHAYLVSRGTFNSDELEILNGLPEKTDSIKLTPTALAGSPSPLHLPICRRSMSESTPRNSSMFLAAGTTTNTSPKNSPQSAPIIVSTDSERDPVVFDLDLASPGDPSPEQAAACSKTLSEDIVPENDGTAQKVTFIFDHKDEPEVDESDTNNLNLHQSNEKEDLQTLPSSLEISTEPKQHDTPFVNPPLLHSSDSGYHELGEDKSIQHDHQHSI